MISRMGASAAAWLVVSALLSGAVPYAGAAGRAATDVPASSPVAPGSVSAPSSGTPSEAADEEDSALVELSLVVPAVDGGAVEESPEVRAARADEDVVLAEDVVDAERVASEIVETDAFQTIGVTWPEDADVTALQPQMRVRSDGEWSEWAEFGQDSEVPDAGTPDAAHATRGGTEPVWVGDADAIQLSFAADDEAGPDGLALVLVGSDEVPLAPDDVIVGSAATTDTDVEQASFTQASFTQASSTQALFAASAAPAIISRAEWGARDQVCTPDVASRLVGAVVHHTAGSNNYATVAEAMQQIRNDQRYHIESRGWCDLGYNFVVDKWGNIYEGRARSLTQPVVGVHAGGFNTGTVGVSMLGTYGVAPSAATQQAVAQIIGWRLGFYGVNPMGSMVYHTGSGENSKFQDQDVSLPRVFGHRDVAYTACPGDGGYNSLPNIRAIAGSLSYGARFRQAGAVVNAMYEDILRRGVDPSGLSTWSAMLAGGSGLPALVGALTDSDEYIRLRISQAYRDVLGRSPEPAGLEHWYREIRARRATVDDVARRFLSSAEFRDRSGGTDRGYVLRMYTSVLGRPASAAEVGYWSSEIARLGRDRVTDLIWFSGEAARYRAGTYYETFLKRAAEPAGRELWANVLLTQGEGAVRIGIAGSDEYRVKALVRYP